MVKRPKIVTTVRLAEPVKAAVEAMADATTRSQSETIEVLVVDGLTRRGYLPDDRTPRGRAKRQT